MGNGFFVEMLHYKSMGIGFFLERLDNEGNYKGNGFFGKGDFLGKVDILKIRWYLSDSDSVLKKIHKTF